MYNTKKRNVILSILITLLIAFSGFFAVWSSAPKRASADSVKTYSVGDVVHFKSTIIMPDDLAVETFNFNFGVDKNGSMSSDPDNIFLGIDLSCWDVEDGYNVRYLNSVRGPWGFDFGFYSVDLGGWRSFGGIDPTIIYIQSLPEDTDEQESLFKFLSANEIVEAPEDEPSNPSGESEEPTEKAPEQPINEEISNWINENFGLGISGSVVTIAVIVLVVYLLFGRRK